jgi:hypothetical protein
MKKPKTYQELWKLVSPRDLYEVLCFSGINDNRIKNHSELKDKYAREVWGLVSRNWMDGQRWKDPKHSNKELDNEFYRTIILCIQDFYYWGHQFGHSHSHIYQRVMNALEIPMNKITPIMDKID